MEDIKLLVQEEGRSARNLVAFNVPVIQTQCDSTLGKVMKKPPTSPRPQIDPKKEELLRPSKRSRESSQSGSRVRSASTGRDKKSELHARYWAFLFGNLQRAVDEIYQTCESDESVTECKEVIMVLDNYTREFKNLINWFKIKWDYETTPPPQRPRSLAWEIRKSSPGKIRHKSLDPISFEKQSTQMPINISKNSSTLNLKSDSFDNIKNKEKLKNLETSLQDTSVLSEADESAYYNMNVNFQKACGSNKSNKIMSFYSKKNQQDNIKNLSSVINKEDTDKGDVNFKIFNHRETSVMCNMIDELCQTDPEENVDENGPKFISTGQQTCPTITGFHEVDIIKKEESQDKEINKSFIKKQSDDNCNKNEDSVCVSKNVKGKIIDDPAKTSIKTVTSSIVNKSVLPTFQNTASVKTVTRNSYSFATTNSPRPLNLAHSRTKSFMRASSTNSNPKTANSLSLRQPWGAPNKVLTVPSSSTPRLTRSRTTVEISAIVPTATKPSKALSELKQEAENEVKKSANFSNSASFSKKNNSSSIIPLSCSASSSFRHQESSGSIENLTSQKNTLLNEEDDGWVKVRSRSRFSPATKTGDLETTLSRSASSLKPKADSKSSVKTNYQTRFYQPSSAFSLPTLAFSTSECKENIDLIKLVKTKSDPKKLKENLKTVKKLEKNNKEDIKRKNSLDKNKKNCNRLLNEKNLNKTVEKKPYIEIEKKENEKNKSLTSEMVTNTSKTIVTDQEAMDDEENNFDEELKKNKETEEMLQKEISELEAADIEVDIETGDEETDGEATTGTEEEPEREKNLSISVAEVADKKVLPKRQLNYQKILIGMSWADHMDTLDELEKLVVQDCSKKGMTQDEQMDTLERLEEFVARHPGRALELHQKLSSPSRRRTMLDTVKRFQARQAKASAKREQLKLEKAQKLRELLKKVDEVKAAKDKLIEDKRQRLEMKLKRAAENRNLHLKEIMRKAHDEEEKLKEIAFINELEAQNKRHDFITLCQEQEGRLQGIHEERQRKQEEKAAKEAAVEERRKAIEAERQEKLEKMQEKQRMRDEQADKKKQEKEKERKILAREKARDRSERLEALHAAQLEAQEELQKKIQQKQEDYARRHEENIEQIRQKALELSILKCSDDVAPKSVPYETQKLCTACNVLIGSEVYLLSHLRGKKHQDSVKNQINEKDLSKEEMERYNIKIIVNAPSDKIDPKVTLDRERIKFFKKKCKKIRLRMISKGEEYLTKLEIPDKFDSSGKIKLQKCLKDIEKVLKSQGKGQWSDSAITILERSMGEIGRTFTKKDPQDQLAFMYLNGFSVFNNVLQLDMDVPPNMTPFLPQKCFVTASLTYLAAVSNSPSNCNFLILSNKIILLLDLLMKRLTTLIPDQISSFTIHHSKSSLPVDLVASMIMRTIAKILICGNKTDLNFSDEYLHRLQDIISYTISVGIVDKLTRYCKSVRDPIDDDLSAAQFLLSILEILTSLTVRCKTVRQGNEDPTQLLATLQVTELVGAVSILYGMLLHQGTPPRLIDTTPPTLPSHTIAVATGTIRLLRSVAELDLQMFQSILGAEGISLQFRHIASYLLWYCCQDKEKTLLHEVVAVVGFFAVQHRDNQMILQSGSTPTVLQQLCSLPFPYFSNPELSALLFPTLLACCMDNNENKAILEQEISYSLLEDFMESDAAKNHPLVHLLLTKGASKS